MTLTIPSGPSVFFGNIDKNLTGSDDWTSKSLQQRSKWPPQLSRRGDRTIWKPNPWGSWVLSLLLERFVCGRSVTLEELESCGKVSPWIKELHKWDDPEKLVHSQVTHLQYRVSDTPSTVFSVDQENLCLHPAPIWRVSMKRETYNAHTPVKNSRSICGKIGRLRVDKASNARLCARWELVVETPRHGPSVNRGNRGYHVTSVSWQKSPRKAGFAPPRQPSL